MSFDEINAVRDARPHAEPDTEARAAARATLYAEFHADPAPGRTQPTRARRRRGLVWPVGTTAGVAATCLVVGLVVAQGGPDGSDTGRPGVGVTEGSTRATGSAGVDATTARVMELAARTVAQQQAVRPQPHDWLYAKTVGSEGDDASENWVRFDGEQSAIYLKGKLMRADVDYGPGERPPYKDYEFFERLSDDPAEARAQIYRDSRHLEGPGWGDADARAFANILELFEDTTMMPPDAQATLYRAIATIPGVEIDRDVVDAAGRHGIGVSRSDGRYRATLILAEDDYRYLGQRYVADRTFTTTPVPPPGEPRKAEVTRKGHVLTDIALVRAGIVSGPGARP